MSTTAIERTIVNSHPQMSWRSTVAGFIVSLLVFGILLSLGLALGGVSLTDGADLRNSGIIGAVWMLLSILISLFVGSYFSGRVSNYFSNWTGIAQGAVLCALFIGFVLWQFANFAGVVTRSAGSMIGGAAQMAPAAQGAASQMNIGLNEVVEDNLGGVQFNGDATTIMGGVASRLIRGNPESAKNYLAANSNLTRAEVDRRIAGAEAQLKETGDRAREAAAGAMKVTGWSLFGVTLLGLIVSIIGGVLGIASNRVAPADRVGVGVRTFRPATT